MCLLPQRRRSAGLGLCNPLDLAYLSQRGHRVIPFNFNRRDTLANISVRNLPDDVRDRLRDQATSNGRSLEAEVRSILIHSVIASSEGGFGHRIRERYGRLLGDDLSVERDTSANQPGLFD